MIRLIDQVDAQRQLLAAIAAVPTGQKLHLPKLRDALVNQADVVRGIEALIAAGELDAATLRPPASVATAGTVIAADEAARLDQYSSPVRPAGDCGAPDGESANAAGVPPTKRAKRASDHADFSGAALAAEVDALLKRDSTVCKSGFGLALFNSKNGVETLRKRIRVRAATAAKVRALLADPPRKQVKVALERAPRPYCQTPHHCTAPARGPCRTCFIGTYRRRSDGIRKGLRAAAAKRIEQGLPIGSTKSAALRCTQGALENQQREQARLADPVEQAKTILRKRYSPVCNAEVTGGPAGHFNVGRKTVDRTELLAMADRLAAVVAQPSKSVS